MVSTDAAPEPVATLVDTNVLLDVASEDAKWGEWSEQALHQAREDGRVVINPIIYAEVSIGYDTIEVVDRVLSPKHYEREDLPYPAGFLAGKAFLAYRRAGGAKTAPVADFYIGAHAATRSYRLLTPRRFPLPHLLPDGSADRPRYRMNVVRGW